VKGPAIDRTFTHTEPEAPFSDRSTRSCNPLRDSVAGVLITSDAESKSGMVGYILIFGSEFLFCRFGQLILSHNPMISLEIQIRSCKEQDLRRVTQIEDLSFDEPYPYHLFVAFLLDFPEGFRVAVTEDKLIWGYCILSHSTRSENLMISSIAVHPDFRQRGIGRMLLADSIRIAKESFAPNQIKRLILQVALENGPAQSLYREFGFRSTRKLPDYYGEGRDAMQLELIL
jgi:[ribosomal protein S18]-alanine N-acetyltransferase